MLQCYELEQQYVCMCSLHIYADVRSTFINNVRRNATAIAFAYAIITNYTYHMLILILDLLHIRA